MAPGFPVVLVSFVALACGGPGASGGATPAGGDGSTITPACTDGTEACAFVQAHASVRQSARPGPVPALDPLTWSTQAAVAAEEWARQCSWRHDPELPALRLGQNLYASTDEPSPATAVGSWGSEAADYDRDANRCAAGKVCGHYTQLVWRGTRQVGCAKVSCTTGSPFGSGRWWYVVCDYAPPGNVIGQRPY
jgi:hypothetical protein